MQIMNALIDVAMEIDTKKIVQVLDFVWDINETSTILNIKNWILENGNPWYWKANNESLNLIHNDWP